jgi:hypothetical protein
MRKKIAVIGALTGGSFCIGAQGVTITGVGRYQFTTANSQMSNLSGLTYVGNNKYWGVDDNSSVLYSFSIGVDPNTGGADVAQADLDAADEGFQRKGDQQLVPGL